MESLRIRDLYKDTAAYAGKEVTVCGWVKNIRDSKTFGFLVISDGTYFSPLQVVYHDTMENFTQVCKLNVGAAVIVKGKLVLTPDQRQPFEVQADAVEVEGASAPDYPLQPKKKCRVHPAPCQKSHTYTSLVRAEIPWKTTILLYYIFLPVLLTPLI
jgi:asparaginyl-tRNA synthetase